MYKKRANSRERETERQSKTFGEITNQQTDLTVSYKAYNIRTGRCTGCKYGAVRKETGDCIEDTNVECFESK